MDNHVLFIQIAAILILARLFAEIAVRLNAPRVIGELCAGILLGPSILGWIEPSDPLKFLAEIGIILLLFEIGLESDLGRMLRTGSRAAILALSGFVLPFILGTWFCYAIFDLSLLVSLFVGGTLTATSIGVTVRVLADLGRQSSREGQIVLGAAVIDDIMGVILLAILYEFSVAGRVSLVNTGWIVTYVFIFFLLAPVVAKLLSYVIHHFNKLSDTPGIIPVALVSLVMLFAALAHSVGVPELLGGFAAGIALSRRFFLPLGVFTMRIDSSFHQVMSVQMKPIIQLFTPIFFVMVGLSLDLSAVDWGSPFIWVFSILVTVIAIAGKVLGGLLVPENPFSRVAIGMAMVPRGEVGLVFAELGRVSGIFNNEIYAGMVIVIAYTTLLSPFWIKLYYRMYGNRFTSVQLKHDRIKERRMGNRRASDRKI